MKILEEDVERRDLAEAVANAIYPQCPRCGGEPVEATVDGLPMVRCDKYHAWNLVDGYEGEEEDEDADEKY